MKRSDLDLIGIGIGPFNLSLAALLHKHPEIRSRFFDAKASFQWHSEVLFKDSVMQTSWLKDLVTPVDPTSPFSFLNYLVTHGLFYAHLNTDRRTITRREFERYCQWVASQLHDQLSFSTAIQQVEFIDGTFVVRGSAGQFTSRHLCVATGHVPSTPEFARPHLGSRVFHAKSPELANIDLRDKRVVIIGGGQTGLEIFRNALQEKWGATRALTLVSRRHTLEPLDETPFTNEYFTPAYVQNFYQTSRKHKESAVAHQRLASDGNTPFYLNDLFNELYQLRYVERSPKDFRILARRCVAALESHDETYRLTLENHFTENLETLDADIVILSTGFKVELPSCLAGIRHLLDLDESENFRLSENFQAKWEHQQTNHLFALNFGRRTHGIAEPQTSLMAWRSGQIANQLLQKSIYSTQSPVANFVTHGSIHG